MISQYVDKYCADLSDTFCTVRLSRTIDETSGIKDIWIEKANGDTESLLWHFEMWLWDNHRVEEVPEDPTGLLMWKVLAHLFWQNRGEMSKLLKLFENNGRSWEA